MDHPNFGDKVRVWSHPGRKVRSHDPSEAVRFFPDGKEAEDGIELVWSSWLEQLFLDGVVYLTNPHPQCTIEDAKLAADKQRLEQAAKDKVIVLPVLDKQEA